MAATPLLHPDRVDGAVHLLSCAAESLASAHWARTAHGRIAGTRLAVLRAAAAVLAVRGRPRTADPAESSGPTRRVDGRPEPRSTGPLDVWCLLPRVAPELTEWAQFFGAVLPGETRSGASMSVREVDDLLRQGEEFVQLVAGLLGLPPVPVTGELTSLTVPGGRG
ncbi:SAV_6107 family HEPN domain-containing protein [Janibacter alittae]|uniref:SAV_6107 family HEPN domain-containing protein n=1 Tax=Janibacter alittae TaxID=3115209 RepID=A0ABZ2ML30_9MICO